MLDYENLSWGKFTKQNLWDQDTEQLSYGIGDDGYETNPKYHTLISNGGDLMKAILHIWKSLSSQEFILPLYVNNKGCST
jgi:hypothetical protein